MKKVNKNVLTDLQPETKSYLLSDKESYLILEVLPNGLKEWRLRTNVLGRTKQINVGSFPELNLSRARDVANELLKLQRHLLLDLSTGPWVAGSVSLSSRPYLSSSLSPEPSRNLTRNMDSDLSQSLTHEVSSKMSHNTSSKMSSKMNLNLRSKKVRSFGDLANVWLDQKKNLSNNRFKLYVSTLKSYILPILGRQSLDDISPSSFILDLLKPLRERGALEVADSSLKICRMIFRFGLSQGLVSIDPTRNLPDFDAETITCQIVPNIDPYGEQDLDFLEPLSPLQALDQNEVSARVKAHHFHVKRNPLAISNANLANSDS
jgi:hypothetical protein